MQQILVAKSARGAKSAPPSVTAVLRTSGRPLTDTTRASLEKGFGHDFSRVRIHEGAMAAESAAAVNARAYTAGSHIVFGAGQFSPDTMTGHRLLAHELAHVIQQHGKDPAPRALRMGRTTDPTEVAAEHAAQAISLGRHARVVPVEGAPAVARATEGQDTMEVAEDWWGKKKNAAYDAIINAVRSAKSKGLAELHDLARLLPSSLRPLAQMVIDQVEICCDLVISLGLAIIGLGVGLVSGIAHALWGLVNLMGMIILFVAGFFGQRYRDEFDERANAALNGLKQFPDNVKKLWQQWRHEFDVASTERQTLMIGELTGQIEAILLQALAGGGAAGAIPKISIAPLRSLAVATGRVAAGAGAATLDLAGPGMAALATVNTTNQIAQKAKQGSGEGGGSGGKGKSGKSAPPPAGPPMTPEEAFGDLSSELGNEPASSKPRPGGIKQAMKDAEGFKKGNAPGQVNMSAQAHKDASEVRKILKVTGTDYQSAHAGASSWLSKRVWRSGKLISIDYSRSRAATRLLSPKVHQSLDKIWKNFAIKMRQEGVTRVTGAEMLRVMHEAAAGSELIAAEQGSMMMMIDSEFSDLGLLPDDVIELPYTNVGPQ
jgi:hypothetical protein